VIERLPDEFPIRLMSAPAVRQWLLRRGSKRPAQAPSRQERLLLPYHALLSDSGHTGAAAGSKIYRGRG